VCIKVEVVDVSLDYNILLGRIWTYAMQAVVATFFRVLLFPHEGWIISIDQLSFSRPDPSSGVSMVPMIDNPQSDIINVGVGLCPPLMGTFNYPPPTDNIHYMSDRPWDDLHHRSYFLLELRRIEVGEFTLTMTGDKACPINTLATQMFTSKEIWKPFLKRYLLISLESLALWRILI
jgi:hypothetical protein